jgi:predicted dehydrogenase
MRLAFLGTDRDTLRLLTAAVHGGHDVVWLGEVRPEDASEVRRLVPQIGVTEDWELLLDHSLADAVIVGRGTASEELRAEQLKRLVTDAVSLLVVHPASASVLTYYELDMARRETGGLVRHFNPLADHPALAALAEWVQNGHEEIGPVYQVTFARALADSTRVSVLGQFARDVELLRAVAGGIRRASAIGPRDADGSFAALQVQMETGGEASLRWSVVPPDSAYGGALQLVGERGTITLQIPADSAADADWELKTVVDGQIRSEPLAPWDSARGAIDALAKANVQDREAAERASTWESATQAMEVVDAAELSLQKGRSVDVFHQQLTEQLAFRGTMAALGFGLLFVGLAVMVVAGVLGDVARVPFVRHWPLVLLGVLAVFLLLQGVPLLVAKKRQ